MVVTVTSPNDSGWGSFWGCCVGGFRDILSLKSSANCLAESVMGWFSDYDSNILIFLDVFASFKLSRKVSRL